MYIIKHSRFRWDKDEIVGIKISFALLNGI